MSGCDRSRLVVTCCLLLLAGTETAIAQSTGPGDVLTIRERKATDGAPTGILTGPFTITPGIQLVSTWDDNILLTRNNTRSDIVTEAKPAIGVQTNWDRHGLFFGAEGEFGKYADNSHLDYSDYAFLASGQYDFAYETALVASISQFKKHEDREALSTPAGADPVPYTVDRQQLDFRREAGIIKLKARALNEEVSFDDGLTPGGGSSDRQNNIFSGTLSYDYMPGNGFFISPEWSTTDYSLRSGAAVSSDGGDFRAGWTFDHPHGVGFTIFAGYLFREYETGLGDTGDFYWGGELDWDVTQATTASVVLDTNFNETSVSNAAGNIQATHKFIVETDLTEFLIGEIMFGFDDNEYVGGGAGVDRETTLYYGGIGAKYKISDRVDISFGYRHEQRDSQVANDEYENNRATISLVYRH